MKKLFLLYFILCLPLYFFAQPVDSVALSKGDAIYTQAVKLYGTNTDSTIIYLEQSLPFYKESNSKEVYITRLLTLSTLFKGEERFREYYSNAIYTIEESERLFDKFDVNYANALNNLSTYYYNEGNYQKTVNLLKECVEIYRKNNVEKGILINGYINLANAYTWLGDYEQAHFYLDQFFDNLASEKLKKRSLLIGFYNSKAWNFDLEHQLDSAEAYYAKSRFIIGKEKLSKQIFPYAIRSYQGSAEVAIKSKDFKRALGYLKKVLGLQIEDTAFRKGKTYELLAEVYFLKGEKPKALNFIERGIELSESENLKFKIPDIARKYQKKAELFQSIDSIDIAIYNYNQALKILGPGVDYEDLNYVFSDQDFYSRLDVIENVLGKGKLLFERYKSLGNLTDLISSKKTFEIGRELVNGLRQEVVTAQAKNNLSERAIVVYEYAIRIELEEYRLQGNEENLRKAFAFAESNKSLLLLESVNEQAALGIKGLPDSLLQRDKDIRLAIAFYQKQIFESGEDASMIKKDKDQVIELKNELQSLTDHFEENYPRFHQLKYQNEVADLSSIQKHLANEKQALIEYFVGEEKTYAFVVWSDGCKVFEIEKGTEVFTAVEQLKTSIEQIPDDDLVQENYKDFTSAAHFLYQQILAPALEQLPSDIKALKIIPDFHFNHVPFDLLLMKKAPAAPYFSIQNLDYVLEGYQVSYDYSATWMLKSKENKRSDYESDFIAYAPSFKSATEMVTTRSCTAGELYDLTCSEKEVNNIQSILGGDVRLNQLATKQNFESEAGRYKILHMATHACIDEANPLFNKIFLTDDYLSNADLYNTSLNAELVVLSACNTGSGKLVKGEGVLSLARGFVQAGCASSIVSRWSVDDCATSDIMQTMYKELKGGKRKDEALRLAKLDYLSKADGFTSHPYYWSAFVGYGDMGELEISKGFNQLWIWLGMIFGIVFLLWKRRP